MKSRNNLHLSRKQVEDFRGQVSFLPELRGIVLYDRGGHPLALKPGSGHDWEARSNWIELWVLELEVGEGESMGRKGQASVPL